MFNMAHNMAYAPLVSAKVFSVISAKHYICLHLSRKTIKIELEYKNVLSPTFTWLKFVLFLSSISGNPNSDTNSALAIVFIVLFCVAAIALVLVTYLYLALRKRLQGIPQVGNAQDREENCVANGSTVRYVTSLATNGSPCINRANGSVGNHVTIDMNGSPCIGKSNGNEGNVENGYTAGSV